MHGEIRFRPAIDDLELEPELVLNAVDEGRAVGGEAAGLGRDHAGAGDAARLDLLLADMQRLEGAPDGALAQAVAVPEALAETDDAGEGVDDPEADMRRLGDQETAIVGAEVEGRIGRAAAAAGPPERPIAAIWPDRPAGGWPTHSRARTRARARPSRRSEQPRP